MTYTEAMRLGAAVTPQGFGQNFRKTDGVVYTCAQGAAEYGIGSSFYALIGTHVTHSCPACESSMGSAPIMAVHLNDCHKWSRNAIADYLEANYPLLEMVPNEPVVVNPVLVDKLELVGVS